MVFAKNQATASLLSKAWRERDQVSKHYLAVVREWPPYHEERLEKGRISFPLAPSVNERLKWKVDNNGKESVTEWRICEELKETRCAVTEDDPSNNPLILELKPITGRTHQLRVHCAHVGSGIEGDSLYGATKMEFDPHSQGKLKLHAWKLVFPHPDHRQGLCEFRCYPTWDEWGKKKSSVLVTAPR